MRAAPKDTMRTLLLALALLGAFAGCALGGGFRGPGASAPVHTAAEVLAAADDAPCVLEGRLVARVRGRKNRYLFEDASGRVIVEIKRKVFGGLTVTPDERVRLEGEVETSDKYPNEMEADTLTLIP